MEDLREYKALFNQSGIRKQLHITFFKSSIVLKDEDIVSESMEISESLCSGAELRFGSCESSVFKLRIIGNVIPLIGETFTVTIYVGDITEPFVLGTYKVTSDKPTADRRYRDIVAHDVMYDIIDADVAAWYNGILPNKDSATTLRAFRDSFMAYFGVEQEEITLPNDEMVVERTIDPESISGKDVLSAICELTVVSGILDGMARCSMFFFRNLSMDFILWKNYTQRKICFLLKMVRQDWKNRTIFLVNTKISPRSELENCKSGRKKMISDASLVMVRIVISLRAIFLCLARRLRDCRQSGKRFLTISVICGIARQP